MMNPHEYTKHDYLLDTAIRDAEKLQQEDNIEREKVLNEISGAIRNAKGKLESLSVSPDQSLDNADIAKWFMEVEEETKALQRMLDTFQDMHKTYSYKTQGGRKSRRRRRAHHPRRRRARQSRRHRRH